ncbi:dTDP-glucose 4,6-dehydratase [Amycolatopsis sp. WQ 127309]|uniref:dTDP-glucose 4,6-dehydratase n=1 Tax=Amycolatopsis sp. WQ 127309 TaxID=2932773 RepID=UPI001FF45115|nr:dTDP-glucose 4,6-dehydratase [Amycolatopsis sp. WQ 127309]UOZ03311.1 dTDP-glucose 4,6-dehydratase [Amycolatopsis sp. WQ 127309]
MHTVFVTGGAGFIGSHLVDRLVGCDDITQVTVLDALTYAGDRRNLADAEASGKVRFVHGDIRDHDLVSAVLPGHDWVVHLAAESHVDRSLIDVGQSVHTNVMGTQALLDVAMRAGVAKLVHVSTDEVYGPLPTGCATEASPLRPTVPYAASKACSDLLATSYYVSCGVPVCITRSSNNYGPRQHPEKLIPRFLGLLLAGQQITVHGRGRHVRNWLHVEDNCRAIEQVLRAGVPGETYNIGGGTDLTTIELTMLLLEATGRDADAIAYVPDRPANDVRYSTDWSKIAALGFTPRRELPAGLADTVAWYRRHPERLALSALGAGLEAMSA